MPGFQWLGGHEVDSDIITSTLSKEPYTKMIRRLLLIISINYLNCRFCNEAETVSHAYLNREKVVSH